ncbi:MULTISPECIES: hypothetical protein [unclassified Rhizobium]|nr:MULTISPECIES: hypothetical protein [unclassified Rhizobium]
MILRPLIIILTVVAIACFAATLLNLQGCARYQPPGAGIWKAL